MAEFIKIKNSQALNKSPLRQAALQIAESGLVAIDTKKTIDANLKIDGNKLTVGGQEYELKSGGRLLFFAVGKCAFLATSQVINILGEKIDEGVAIDVAPAPIDLPTAKIKFFSGDHPFPSAKNVEATKTLINFLSDAGPQDFVLGIVSGGGSTLLCQPTGFDWEKEKAAVSELFKSGANIQELNTFRKHISLARGGQLANLIKSAESAILIFSDVPGDNLSFISSGPTVLDETTALDAREVCNRYNVCRPDNFLPAWIIETPKDNSIFSQVNNFLVMSNKVALSAMIKQAESLGFKAQIKQTAIEGEAQVIGRRLAQEIKESPAKTAFLYGGETTVKTTGSGRGGRNQEVVLAALPLLSADTLIMSLASDGVDNTEVAGALADNLIIKKTKDLNLSVEDYLTNNDSFTFFEQVGGHIFTGQTGSNVSDLMLILKM